MEFLPQNLKLFDIIRKMHAPSESLQWNNLQSQFLTGAAVRVERRGRVSLCKDKICLTFWHKFASFTCAIYLLAATPSSN